MKIEPLDNVVIIRRLAPETVSDGGIHIAWDENYKEDIGEVVYAGPGKRVGCKTCGTEHRLEPAVKPGDRILFSTNGHQVTTIKGEQLVVLREPSIIGVFAHE